MSKLQGKLNYLLDKYAVKNRAVLSEDNKSVTISGKEYKLLPWRNERRIVELKKIVESGTVGQISHFKTMSINPKTTQLDYIIKREIDTAEFIAGFKVTQIFKAQNGNACSVMCMTDKNAVLTLELSTTLPAKAEIIDKHEIITDRGTACDRAVDSQTPLYSVYVYGEKQKEYIDVDFELYGLSVYEISVVRQAFDIAKDEKLGAENNKADARLEKILQKAAQSEKTTADVAI